MKIILPENIADINLGTFQKYCELMEREDLTEVQKNDRKINLFTGISIKDVPNIAVNDYNSILVQIDFALNKNEDFTPFFKLANIEFGFIPNLNEITNAEFLDIKSYETETENFHKLMAVLFRPIKNKDAFGNYEIHSYKGTEEYFELMKMMPMNVVNGALFFFLNLTKDLWICTQKFMEREQVREVRQ